MRYNPKSEDAYPLFFPLTQGQRHRFLTWAQSELSGGWGEDPKMKPKPKAGPRGPLDSAAHRPPRNYLRPSHTGPLLSGCLHQPALEGPGPRRRSGSFCQGSAAGLLAAPATLQTLPPPSLALSVPSALGLSPQRSHSP